jgi:protease-4
MKPTTHSNEQPKQNKTFLFVMIGFFVFFIFSFIFVVYSIQKVFGKSTPSLISSSDEITLIEINGPIYESDDILRRIRKFKKSNKKALLLRLDSPGGAVAPSQEIYSEVLSAREAKKIVVASMGSVAASGAYYIASACDKIVADPGTITASIGVIAEFPDASILLKKVGVNFQTVKSGQFKDTGSFNRPLSPAEKAYLQETINDVFEQFLGSVVTSRKAAFQERIAFLEKKKPAQITDPEIRSHVLKYADGRILTGKKAYELGFVDKLGNYYDAVQLTADLAGIKGEPSVRLDEPVKFKQFLNELLPFSYFTKTKTSFQLDYRAF